jgi:hypothetical protein
MCLSAFCAGIEITTQSLVLPLYSTSIEYQSIRLIIIRFKQVAATLSIIESCSCIMMVLAVFAMCSVIFSATRAWAPQPLFYIRAINLEDINLGAFPMCSAVSSGSVNSSISIVLEWYVSQLIHVEGLQGDVTECGTLRSLQKPLK